MKFTAVYGSPGCGKSTELVNHVNRLLESGVERSDILYLSFTKAPVLEVMARTLNSKANVDMATIHSFVMRLTGVTPAQLMTQYEQSRFAKVSRVAMARKEIGVFAPSIFAVKSLAANRMTSLDEEFSKIRNYDYSYAITQSVITAYEAYKRERGLIDFDDILLRYAEFPVDHHYSHIILDEAQDLTPLQWAVFRTICRGSRVVDVAIAGDPDQCLYEWNGSDAMGMLSWREEFNAEVNILEQSYRVPALCHALAMKVLGRVKTREHKPYNPRPVDGIIERTGNFRLDMLKDKAMVLCRTSSVRNAAIDSLIQSNIAFMTEGGTDGPLQSNIGKAVIHWQRLCRGEPLSARKRAALKRMMLKDVDLDDPAALSKYDVTDLFSINEQFVNYYRHTDLLSEPPLTVSTIHASKGREAEHVILYTEVNGLCIENMDINGDSEHRLWYVGLTRSKNKLTLVSNPTEPAYDI